MNILKIKYKGGEIMNCCSSHHSGHHTGSCTGFMNPQLWSKKKKLEVLEHQLECLEEKKKDIQEAIEELRA